MSGKRNAIRDDGARKRWALDHLVSGCQVCGTSSADFRGFSVHHLLGGNRGRSDEPTNYLLTCGACHDLCENKTVRHPRTGLVIPPIPLGMALAIKLIRDYEGWDRERLRILSGERLPPLLPPHPWIEVVYGQNRPAPFRPWIDDAHTPILAAVNDWIDSYVIER